MHHAYFNIAQNKYEFDSTLTIEEGWRKKPRQTDVVVFWGKIDAHMLLFRLCSRQVDKRQAGSKMWGDICILHFFKYRSIDFPSNVLQHSGHSWAHVR